MAILIILANIVTPNYIICAIIAQIMLGVNIQYAHTTSFSYFIKIDLLDCPYIKLSNNFPMIAFICKYHVGPIYFLYFCCTSYHHIESLLYFNNHNVKIMFLYYLIYWLILIKTISWHASIEDHLFVLTNAFTPSRCECNGVKKVGLNIREECWFAADAWVYLN